jgi:hypothetical protein
VFIGVYVEKSGNVAQGLVCSLIGICTMIRSSCLSWKIIVGVLSNTSFYWFCLPAYARIDSAPISKFSKLLCEQIDNSENHQLNRDQSCLCKLPELYSQDSIEIPDLEVNAGSSGFRVRGV